MEPVYYGHLGTNRKYPDYQGVLILVILCHLGPQLSVWIMQVSLSSSVHINRFSTVQPRVHNRELLLLSGATLCHIS